MTRTAAMVWMPLCAFALTACNLNPQSQAPTQNAVPNRALMRSLVPNDVQLRVQERLAKLSPHWGIVDVHVDQGVPIAVQAEYRSHSGLYTLSENFLIMGASVSEGDVRSYASGTGRVGSYRTNQDSGTIEIDDKDAQKRQVLEELLPAAKQFHAVMVSEFQPGP